MNCPYCQKQVYGMTGLQEAEKFTKHLKKCRKNPNNFVLSFGKRTAVEPKQEQTLMDALKIRAGSGQ